MLSVASLLYSMIFCIKQACIATTPLSFKKGGGGGGGGRGWRATGLERIHTRFIASPLDGMIFLIQACKASK